MSATLENTKAVEQVLFELAVADPSPVPSSESTSEDPWTIIDEEDFKDDFVVISGPAMVQPWSGNQAAYKSRRIISEHFRSYWPTKKITQPRVVPRASIDKSPALGSSLESLAGSGAGLSLTENQPHFDPLGISVAWQPKPKTLGDEEKKKRLKAAWNAKPERLTEKILPVPGVQTWRKPKLASAEHDAVETKSVEGRVDDAFDTSSRDKQLHGTSPLVHRHRKRSFDWRLEIE